MTIYYSPSTKGFYDDTLGYAYLPEDKIEVTTEQRDAFISEMNSKNKQLVLVDDELVLVDNAPPEATWPLVRAKRNRLIEACDYTQLPDYPGDASAWAAYREILRNIPQSFAAPEDVVWPTPPGS
jgi:hypothetical protein